MTWLIADPEGSGPHRSVAQLMLALAITAMFTALGIMACAVLTSLEQRLSRGQLPPRPGPDGQALDAEQRGGTALARFPRPTGRARAAGLRSRLDGCVIVPRCEPEPISRE
jgi:hypothetical protein